MQTQPILQTYCLHFVHEVRHFCLVSVQFFPVTFALLVSLGGLLITRIQSQLIGLNLELMERIK